MFLNLLASSQPDALDSGLQAIRHIHICLLALHLWELSGLCNECREGAKGGGQEQQQPFRALSYTQHKSQQ